MNRNVCENCDEKPHVLSFNVADTGLCSKCGCVLECWDHDLIKLYKIFSITDDQIYTHLPRLLDSGIEVNNPPTLALIGVEIKKLIRIVE